MYSANSYNLAVRIQVKGRHQFVTKTRRVGQHASTSVGVNFLINRYTTSSSKLIYNNHCAA